MVHKSTFKLIVIVLLAASFSACSSLKNQMQLRVKNTLGFPREEIASVKIAELTALLDKHPEKNIRVKNQRTGEYLPIQWLDENQDGKADELLFQAKVAAKATEKYVILVDSTKAIPESKTVAYSRFVPERTDDYTWENDRVAFRVYGPDAQQRTEQKRENGTLSSGVDLWLKRTDQPVINKWYKGYLSDPNFYHVDRGEGYDPYHVGASRGTGGTGVWEADSLLVSKNFVSYKTIAAGPLRTVFELTYAPYSKYDLRETKRISLDLGSNFSKFEISLDAVEKVPNYAVGITLHKNEGKAKLDSELGTFRHQELIDGTLIGEGVVIDPSIIDMAFVNKSKTPDQSNLLILTRPSNKVIYYAGFAWAKSGQINSVADWDAMLKKQALIIAHPLEISVK